MTPKTDALKTSRSGAMRPAPGIRVHARTYRRSTPRKSARGFTLIELMIAATVIALLAAIAYPTYIGQLRKSQRVEARAALMRGTQLLERSFTQNGGYPATVADFNILFGLNAGDTVYTNPDQPASSSRSKFRFGYAPTANASGGLPVAFALQAVPLPGAIDDPECGTFVMNERGQRSVTGTDTQERCWR
jgi:type IV pilus assembly protein PilE